MPSCAVLNCKNHSNVVNVASAGVSYHRFPQDPYTKEKWIDATARPNWMPTETSTICSEHFLEKDILISKRGNRFIKNNAIPVKKIFIVHDPDNADNKMETAPCTAESRELMILPSSISDTIINKSCMDNYSEIDCDESTFSIPKKKKLEKMLKWNQCKIKKQLLDIKRLQKRNRRLKKKIQKSGDLLKSVQNKFKISDKELKKLKKKKFEIRI